VTEWVSPLPPLGQDGLGYGLSQLGNRSGAGFSKQRRGANAKVAAAPMQIFLWAITEQMVAGVGYARNLEVLRHLKSEVDAYFHTIFASPTVL